MKDIKPFKMNINKKPFYFTISDTKKTFFLEWLSRKKDMNLDDDLLIKYFENVSSYAIQKGLCDINLWHILGQSEFQEVYDRILKDKPFKIIHRKAYKNFQKIGKLYMEFLQDKPQALKVLNVLEPIQKSSRSGLYLDTSSLTQEIKKNNKSSLRVDLNKTSQDIQPQKTELKEEPKSTNTESLLVDKPCTVAYETLSLKKAREISYAEKATVLLKLHFPNGFRLNSPIEIFRYRDIYKRMYDSEIFLNDEQLMKLIASYGTVFDNKVYIIENSTICKLQCIINSESKIGLNIIYYNSFYLYHEDWLFSCHIVSTEMLRVILRKLYPRFVYKSNYFLPEIRFETEAIIIKREIERIWGNDIVLSYDQLEERLPYIPLEKIKQVLSQNKEYIWNSSETYTHISKITITNEEKHEIIDYIRTVYEAKGFASFSDIPFGEIRERNTEVTPNAIQVMVYKTILADTYSRRGKVITIKGDKLDALTIIKEYCHSIDKCTVQDLIELERELTGKAYGWLSLEAGYSTLVRIDKENFLSERYISFKSKDIDKMLDIFIKCDYLPLKGISTFAPFPHCGQAWNLFLLESYCRRFSNMFRFDALSFNSKNIGVIVRKSSSLSYVEIMASAIAEAGVSLNKDHVLDFLYCNGYLGRRSYAKVGELMELAQSL